MTSKLYLGSFLPYQLSITSNAVSDLIARTYRQKFGLKIPEWRVMAVLGEVRSMTQRELVEATHMDKVMVNRATKALGERGLLERAPNRSDGRSHHLALSEIGRGLYDEIVPAALALEVRLSNVLSDTETEQLTQSLAKLKTAAEKLTR
ncbi:MarR family transcriptional regulator [Sphingorhabdus lutea]|uniref:MarR family transcriptional regulator n=1 Tax=Sphingorhabdus lutea TaxID=1913578 RepID=A0A1L3JBM5_9SPHN|nr:MarR family winged helix-turn-helix transcriptional regulator [Sphingorhabdus lutea]APG62531.1 MarR family transcriptional regulator [Sphingorhabdus lutea]